MWYFRMLQLWKNGVWFGRKRIAAIIPFLGNNQFLIVDMFIPFDNVSHKTPDAFFFHALSLIYCYSTK
jgi:hypothetical protein